MALTTQEASYMAAGCLTNLQIGNVAAQYTTWVGTKVSAPTAVVSLVAAMRTSKNPLRVIANAEVFYEVLEQDPPTVASVSPSTGGAAGGTAVALTGTEFLGATGVTVGGSAATSVVVVSDTSITCVTPSGTAGARDVVVTTPVGSGTATGGFTYFAPTFTSVTPTGGTTAGGTAVSIVGTHLTGATVLTFGGTTATSIVVVDDSHITAVTPAKTAGAKDIVITTPNGTVTATGAYLYA